LNFLQYPLGSAPTEKWGVDMYKYCALILTLIYLTGCSTLKPSPEIPQPIPEPQATETPAEPEIIPEEKTLSEKLLEKLLAQHQEWKGTRYRMGSISKSSVDCSGFVLLTFRNQFGIELPRSTQDQHKLGQDVKRDQLTTGDLVFFRTGRYNHVGIYLEDDQFLHASTRAGVKISSLSDTYWKKRYWKAKRLEFVVVSNQSH
jgi:cell wall-associated NlpC family hydrolase